MSIKKVRPYLTTKQLSIILNRLDTSFPDEKQLYSELAIFALKVSSGKIKPVSETLTIEEKIGHPELSPEVEADLFNDIVNRSGSGEN